MCEKTKNLTLLKKIIMIPINELLKIKEQQHQKNNINAPKQLYGATAEYKKYLSTCKFKLVVYYLKNSQGVYFTQYEKDANKNRRYIPSIDFILNNGFMVQNHEIGFTKLINYVMENLQNIDKAMLILNDYSSNTEQTIIKFNTKELALTQYVDPIFKPYKDNILFSHLDGEPIRTDKMREQFSK